MPGTERNWSELGAPGAFDRCVRASIGELYAFAGLLCGNDRDGAERLVTGVFASLRRAVDEGLTDAVSLGALRSAVRRRWIDDRRIGLLAQVDEARRDTRPAATLAELRELERAVLVLDHVNRMPVDRIANELGIPEGRVEQIEASARRRLHGDAEPSRRWIRAYHGDTVHVRPDLADSILGRPAAVPARAPERRTDAAADAGDATGDDTGDEGPPTMAIAIHAPPTDAAPEATGESTAATATISIDEPDAADPGGLVRGAVGAADSDADAGDTAAEAPTEPGQPTGRGRRLPLVLGMVLGVVLVGALVAAVAIWLGSRDDDGEPDSTIPPATTGATPAPGTTVATSTAPVGATVGFAPACVERPAVDTEPPAVDEAALDVFAPLGAAPNIVIDLPASMSAAGAADSVASALRVPGGVVVTVRANESAPFDGSIVARIDIDGTVRWVRCFELAALVVGQSGLPLADTAAISFGDTWQELSLVDGTVGADVAAPPLPASTTRGEPAAWPDASIATLVGETFTAGASNAVTVVLGCLVAGADGTSCDEIVLRGYSTADGLLLWQRDGVRDVEIVSGGYAVVLYAPDDVSAGSWYMINVSDGTAVDGQVWSDPTTFATDGTSASWIELLGGVVARGNAGSVSVWYPAAAGIGTASVSLL